MNENQARLEQYYYSQYFLVIIITLALSILLPMINIIALAFNSGADAQKGGTFWPRQFSLDNFKKYLNKEPF